MNGNDSALAHAPDIPRSLAGDAGRVKSLTLGVTSIRVGANTVRDKPGRALAGRVVSDPGTGNYQLVARE